MTEWYVYMENGVPTAVILGRRDALDRLTNSFRLTPSEKRRLGFVRECMPDLGQEIRLVGYETGVDSRMPDRSIMRVVGPGTEV